MIIKIIHALLLLFIASSIIIPIKQYKLYALTLLLFILFHHITNYGKCGLTEIEYIFTREKYKEGFMYRLIKPIITIPEKYFDNMLYIIHFIWILILFLQLKYLKI